MTEFNTPSITAVTVTYGNRKALLQEVLKKLTTLGLKHIVVVDNGAKWPVKSELEKIYPDIAEIVELKKNNGSAHGFCAGIRKAYESGADYIWLLDDDLSPNTNCLEKLTVEYKRISTFNSLDKFAVLASRPDYINAIKSKRAKSEFSPKSNTFLEFSILDIPNKLLRRIHFFNSKEKTQDLKKFYLMQRSPYGGLFFHRSIIDKIGLPNTDFGLYVDDYEYTERLANCGGGIYLIPEAGLNELETSWNSKGNEKKRTSFENWLTGPDFRVYYTVRNMVYLETRRIHRLKFLYILNKFIYLTILIGLAAKKRKFSRLNLILKAIHKGEKGILGMDPNHPLPNA